MQVRDSTGKNVKARALLDSGSQANFMTERFAKKFNLPRKKRKCSVRALGISTPQAANGVVQFAMEIPVKNVIISEALVLTEITGKLPGADVLRQDFQLPNEFSHLDLADPTFYKSSEVDLLPSSRCRNL